MKCKFCKNKAMIKCSMYGYRKFSFCGECLNWVLLETSEMQKIDLRLKETTENST